MTGEFEYSEHPDQPDDTEDGEGGGVGATVYGEDEEVRENGQKVDDVQHRTHERTWMNDKVYLLLSNEYIIG